jgi:hypothetical protein
VWRELILEGDPDARLAEPADPQSLVWAEQVLGHPLPDPLVELLRESDGVWTEEGLGRLAYPVDRLVAETIELRQRASEPDGYRTSFGDFVAFADPGTWHRFLLRLDTGEVHAWEPIDDTPVVIAEDLECYVRRSMTDQWMSKW